MKCKLTTTILVESTQTIKQANKSTRFFYNHPSHHGLILQKFFLFLPPLPTDATDDFDDLCESEHLLV